MKKNFLGYNTLKGRLIFAGLFSLAIIIGIKIIDTKALHDVNLQFRNSEVGKYLDLMSIFVFVYGMLFLAFSWLGAYDALTFMTSEHAYAPKIIFGLLILFGILQTLTGIETIGRLFEMNGLLVGRNENVYSGLYLFGGAIKGVIYSLVMYAIRVLNKYVMKKRHDKLMKNNHEMRLRKEKLVEMFEDR